MIVVGLTGSIGMGKSAASTQLRRLGIPVFDSDAAVHRLLGPKGAALAPVEAAFPGVLVNGRIDRARLSKQVFHDDQALKRLEKILHPLVFAEKNRFLRQMRRYRQKMAVLDMPLLFEIGGDKEVDAVFVVSCPDFLQEQRVMKRPGMTRKTLMDVRRHQMPNWRKRLLADFVIPTGAGYRLSLRRLLVALKILGERTKTGATRL